MHEAWRDLESLDGGRLSSGDKGSPPSSFNVDGFRVRSDGNETSAGWLAAINTNVTLQRDTIYVVRHLLTSLGGAIATVPWESNKNGGSFAAVTTSSTGGVQAANSASLTNGYTTTEQLAGAGTFTWGAGAGSEDGDATSTVSFTGGDQAEIELVFTIPSADASPGDTIVLRPGPTNITTHNQTLTITVAGAQNEGDRLPLMGVG